MERRKREITFSKKLSKKKNMVPEINKGNASFWFVWCGVKIICLRLVGCPHSPCCRRPRCRCLIVVLTRWPRGRWRQCRRWSPPRRRCCRYRVAAARCFAARDKNRLVFCGCLVWRGKQCCCRCLIPIQLKPWNFIFYTMKVILSHFFCTFKQERLTF